MRIEISPSGGALGAEVRGVDLTAALDAPTVEALRAAWLEHHVLVFPDQAMDDDDLERFTLALGGFSEDPFFGPIPGREHIAAVCRRADERAPLFAEGWHSDWSFLPVPPAGTCLMAVTIPPTGGDTLFANQHLALEQMPAALRARLEGRVAIHSARAPYAPDGQYGNRDHEADRSMDIRPSEKAYETQRHPLIRAHPETGRLGLFSCYGYIIGIEGMAEEPARALLQELYAWQTQEVFQYRHRWHPHMLVLWDNRSVLHRATGGYEGHDRLLHRTTVLDRVAQAHA
ncbi:MAG TPA: TauD/TfdA family dioxygenase [Pseudomonadales bacterium]|nr:TauD/TfdA family dioxygenase [Pseudomonadales bacterium]